MLSITFKSGEQRIVNPHPTFFVWDPKTKESIATKCLNFAHDIGSGIHKIMCMNQGEVVYNNVNAMNEPKKSEETFKENKQELKELKREFRNQKFTQKWNFTTGILKNLITGEEMLSKSLPV